MTTPTRQIVQAAAATLVTQDAAGRTISVRRIGALDRLRLFKAIGAELADNAPYLGMAMLAVSVSAIDGIPVPPPVTESQLESLVQLLGDDGIGAVADCLTQTSGSATESTDPGN